MATHYISCCMLHICCISHVQTCDMCNMFDKMTGYLKLMGGLCSAFVDVKSALCGTVFYPIFVPSQRGMLATTDIECFE